ncbi:DUF6428 family protein [Limnohabitans sp. TS-CS-82]|uniref:DUF6428 family protein n=1 Tax=Limnohabitans sp. TS-CS-82 TaxID=2094193 RepID=UPI00191BCD99|nr:DUF6428 family protein [Limnohabitans sp. TS-CS-82]
MNVEQFLSLLEAHPHQSLRIVLPNGKAIAPHFHITEVGHVVKNFMDCGGTLRKTETCLLQTWVFVDLQHRLETTKLAHVLRIAGDVLPSLDLPVEIEHEAGVVSQYPVISGSSDGQTLTLTTGLKHTACLAMDLCCAPATQPSEKPRIKAGACCSPKSGCC